MISAHQKKQNLKIKSLLALIFLFIITLGCSQTRHTSPITTIDSKTPVKQSLSPQIIKGDEFIIITTSNSDTYESLALQYLGTTSRAWEIKSINNLEELAAGKEIVIPLKPLYPLGIYKNGYQTIPILCYHRFGLSEAKMTVTSEAFEQQMQYLAKNNYNVIHLKDMIPFLNGEQQLPPKSVILTFDDGYKSFYQYAYPVLSKYRFPGTIFVYSDFVGTPDGLSWEEMNEMVNSGLIDIQPHSHTHSNLGIEQVNENSSDYEKRISTEISKPIIRFKKRLKRHIHSFAYPYGDTNKSVIEKLQSKEYKLGLTVHPGSNPAFSSPYMLRRTMVFGDHSLEQFKKMLVSFNKVELR